MKYLLKICTVYFLASLSLQGQNIEVYDFKKLEPRLHIKNDTVYVVNFWATWCKPCVEEMPDFVKFHKNHKDEKIKFLMVSMDMPSQLESRLIPFIKKYKLEAEVILLDDPDANSWIDKVDKSWSGSIPGTLIFKGNSREFYEKSLSYNELKRIITQKLSN